MSSTPDQSDQFVQRLVEGQRGLYAYILQLLPNRTEADDVLQATNLALWNGRAQFASGSNFAAWAAKVAYFEVLTHRKRKSRDRLVFDDSLVHQISGEAADAVDQMDSVLRMLRRCMGKLSQSDLSLIHMQYADGLRSREIAEQTGRSAGAIAQATHRIRMSLLKCIEENKRIAGEDRR